MCALISAVSDALSKQALKTENEYTVAFVKIGGCALLLFPLSLAVGWETPKSGFWLIVFALVPMDVIGSLVYNRAIRLSPLYTTIPFLAFTPVFMLLSSWIILDETPSPNGLAGIGLVTLGGYLLHGSKTTQGWLAPIRALAKEPGSRLMLILAALYSVSASLGKKAVLRSNALTMSGLYFPLVTAGLSPIVFRRGGTRGPSLPKLSSPVWLMIALAVSESLSSFTHFTAIREAQATYMIAIKRLSVVFSILLGWAFFNEKRLGEHLLGASVMIIGVFLIAIR